MGRSRLRGNSPTYLNPSPRQLTPPLSVHEDWEGETAMSTSRPSSVAVPRAGSPGAKLPTLIEILSNTAPPPWTLSAFTAYLSQNHCLETLEFLMEAERYRHAYSSQPAVQHNDFDMEEETMSSMWLKMLQTYIMPYAPREVNLPSPVRDRLINLECSATVVPDPSHLDEAVGIVHELMSDSLLVPFVQSVAPIAQSSQEDLAGERKSRSKLRIPMDLISPSTDDVSQSPKTTLLPLLGRGRASPVANRSASGSTGEPMEVDLITDYSGSPNSTPGDEPMTPPTTPPTADFVFGNSSNNLQRAISGGGWKKMGAKLGLGRKRTIRRSQPVNTIPAAYDIEPMPPFRSNPGAPL